MSLHLEKNPNCVSSVYKVLYNLHMFDFIIKNGVSLGNSEMILAERCYLIKCEAGYLQRTYLARLFLSRAAGASWCYHISTGSPNTGSQETQLVLNGSKMTYPKNVKKKLWACEFMSRCLYVQIQVLFQRGELCGAKHASPQVPGLVMVVGKHGGVTPTPFQKAPQPWALHCRNIWNPLPGQTAPGGTATFYL